MPVNAVLWARFVCVFMIRFGPQASLFFGVRKSLRTILVGFSATCFRGLGLRVRVGVWHLNVVSGPTQFDDFRNYF